MATMRKHWQNNVYASVKEWQVTKNRPITLSSIIVPLHIQAHTNILVLFFDSAGNFNAAKSNMYERGQKALFKLKSVIDREFLSPKISLDLFDKTVKPVCMYGSEIWSCLTASLSSNYSIDQLMKKFQIEKVNISFCKWLLGIQSNFGVLGEIGRYPLFIDIFKGVVKYYQKTVSKAKG